MYDWSRGFNRVAMGAAMGSLFGGWLLQGIGCSGISTSASTCPLNVKEVKVSLAAVTAFGVFGLLPLLVMTGSLGFLKWWVVGFPVLDEHFHSGAPHSTSHAFQANWGMKRRVRK